ncbi:hypothetical protein GF357_03030 [Candidatus Dojkabacteria bacterium]|nr:hypothetical protein [Candidatus Dojkabacteria bacterium]
MKVQVLQGLNLQSQITTTIIEFDTKPSEHVISILEQIRDYHPIFMTKYEATDNSVYIESKLPHLWKVVAPVLNELTTEKITREEAEDFILTKAIKYQVLSMSTIPLLHTAHELGYETTQFFIREGLKPKPGSLYNRYYTIGVGRGSQITVSIASSRDAYISQKTQKDKWLTNTVIPRLGLPIAKWQVVESKEELAEVFKDFPKPFVLKPTGLVGGHGVSINIDTIEKAFRAYDAAEASINRKDRPLWQRKIMIQEQVESHGGEDYRILVIDGKMEIATKRVPAFVMGDGEHSIKELINEINKDPRRDIKNPTHTMKPIVIDEMMHDYLGDNNLTVEYVPQKDEKVRVRLPASMSQGGVTQDVTDQVHPQIKAVVESLAASIHAYTLGVDVMCLDITKPLTRENGSIIEINTMPEAYLNLYPTYGKEYAHVMKTYIEKLMRDNKCAKIVIAGVQDLDTVAIDKMVREKNKFHSDENVGVYKSGAIYINKETINSELETWEAIQALKINASLDAIVLVYEDIEEIEQYGFGFDNVDMLITGTNLTPDFSQKISQYSSEGLIQEIIEV